MRVLVATTAGAGHFGPLVPFAAALGQGGHEVVVAAPASFRSSVERAGFRHHPVADAREEELGAVFARLPHVSPDEANAIVVREVFGRIDTRAALPAMRAIARDWRPDLVLRDTSEYSSYLVAEDAGIPHVQVAIGLAALDALFLPMLEEPLGEQGAPAGLASLWSAPCLSLLPPSFEDPAAPGGARVHRFRDDTARPRGESLPDWWAPSSAADPLVYVTFGTVAGGLGLFADAYRGVVAAVADLSVRVLLTVGEGADPEALGPLPANVHVERWWPQQAVMAHAAAMVGHGGFGTTLLGLAGGVPQVVLPLFADQPYNARRVVAVGAGLALEGGPAAAAEVGSALVRVLGDGAFRAAAGVVAAEIAGLPPASAAVPLLEAVAAGRSGSTVET